MTCHGVDVLTVLTRWLRAGSEPLLCRGTAEQSFCWVTASACQEMSGGVGRCREMAGGTEQLVAIHHIMAHHVI